MNGPEHYREAEALIGKAQYWIVGDGSDEHPETGANMLAQAQVHATLALAAATALSQTHAMSVPDANTWTIATSASAAAIEFARADMERNAAASAREHHDPAEVADVIAMRAEMAQAAGDDGPDVTA